MSSGPQVTQRIGILGDGQLAMMLGEAAEALSLQVQAGNVSDQFETWTDVAEDLLQTFPVLTWERDDVPTDQLQAQAAHFFPPLAVLECIQDRKVQKTFIDELGLPTAKWIAADSSADVAAVLAAITLPAVVKARTGGFDGRGQRIVKNEAELAAALDLFTRSGSIVEQFVPFDDECAAIIARDQHGHAEYYPPTLTVQLDGQLNWGLAPHPQSDQLQQQCQDMTQRLADALQYVGSLAVEFFRCGDALYINEISPRVHNSGHWTIEGCGSSQFTNHLLAVSGQAVQPADLQHCSLMMNAIAAIRPDAAALAEQHDWFFLHDYHKSERTNRKVGHYTMIAKDYAQLLERFDQLPEAWRTAYAPTRALLQASI